MKFGTDGRVLNADLHDYLLPTAKDVPPIFSDFFRQEPVFYRRHFRGWIRDGIKEVIKIQQVSEQNSGLMAQK